MGTVIIINNDQMGSGDRELGRKILLSASVVAIIGLIGEGGLRLRAFVAPQTQGFPTHTATQWERSKVSKNSLGFRDIEHTPTAPASICIAATSGHLCVFV